MVHSLDLQDLAQDANGVLTEVSSSGVFFPTPSYTSNVMSSAENLSLLVSLMSKIMRVNGMSKQCYSLQFGE